MRLERGCACLTSIVQKGEILPSINYLSGFFTIRGGYNAVAQQISRDGPREAFTQGGQDSVKSRVYAKRREGETMSNETAASTPAVNTEESGADVLVAPAAKSAAQIAREVQRRRTFGIISHPDAGKTTLT